MATGIVSIAAVDHGYRAISDVLIVLAAVALPVLIVAAATAWRRESWDLTNLDVSLRLCAYIAACAVVGARLAEHGVVLWMLAGMALQGWLSLAPVMARRMWRVYLLMTAWIPPLIYLTVRRFRRRRALPPALWWAAVFPLGMYSAATYATAVETGWRWLTVVSQVFFWIAFAAWVIVASKSCTNR